MIDEIKSKALAIRERKRAELQAAIEGDELHDPLTTILISLAISSAVSAASYALSLAFAPKQQPRQQGRLQGSIQLQNSEQGIFIPEIYGGGPDATFVTGSNPTYQNNANGTAGANGSFLKSSGSTTAWDCGASHNVAIASGDTVKFTVIRSNPYAIFGFTADSSPTSYTDFLVGIQWNPDGSVTLQYNNGAAQVVGITTSVVGDEFTIEIRGGRFRFYKGAAEIQIPNFVPPAPTFPLYAGVAAEYIGAGVSNAKIQINNIGDAPNAERGGVKVPAIITWSSGIRKNVTTTTQQTGGKGFGGGGSSETVETTTYDIDYALMFANKGPHSLLRLYANADVIIDQYAQATNPTGVYDPGTGADPDYDPTAPPDPSQNYLTSQDRLDGAIAVDGDGVGTGTVQGGSTSFAIYPGNDDQQPDPTVEADVDAKNGSGSTPAFKNKFYVVLDHFNLSRFGGVAPNHTAVLEHQTLRTLDTIYASLCERVDVLSADSEYDFTDLSGIQCRGLLIAGRPFAPAEIIDSPEIKLAYNYFATEVEDQIVGFVEGGEPELEIDDIEIGWLDGDEDLPDVLPEVDSFIAPEITHPREIHIKSIDPDNEWDPNTASERRQITDGKSVELLEVQVTQLADERRAMAQRALYQRYVAGTVHKFTLPWTYIYLHPGYRIVINRAEGFTHTLRLTSISGGVGVLDCEGVSLEPAVYTQPANGVFPPGYVPPQPIPAMIIMTMLDIPQFRDEDDGKSGFYAGGTPRTAIGQSFQGWTLMSNRNSVWSTRGSSRKAAIIGSVVSYTIYPTAAGAFDNTGTITVDLYGTDAILSSVSEAAVTDGENRAIADESIFGFATATQVAGYPNRWILSDLLSGLSETEFLWNSIDFTGKRFVLLDDAIQFIPAGLNEVIQETEYRGVASGQSLGDAASFNFSWTGGNLRPLTVTDIIIAKDASNDFLITFFGRPRPTEMPPAYTVEVWSDHSRTDPSKLRRRIPVTEGTTHACLLDASGDYEYNEDSYVFSLVTSHADKNNLIGDVTLGAAGQTIETLYTTFTRFDFTFRSPLPAGYAAAAAQAGITHSERLDTEIGVPRSPDIDACPVFIEWVGDGITGWDENIYSYGTLITTRSLDGSAALEVRYSILLAGTEYRVYANYSPAAGQVPLAIIPFESGGAPFPLRLKMFLVDAGSQAMFIDNIVTGGALGPRTIYSAAQQIEDFGVVQSILFLRIYQNARYEGIGNPVDV